MYRVLYYLSNVASLLLSMSLDDLSDPDLSCSASALADDLPAPPTNVTVARGLLTWTPVDSETDVTYTVSR